MFVRRCCALRDSVLNFGDWGSRLPEMSATSGCCISVALTSRTPLPWRSTLAALESPRGHRTAAVNAVPANFDGIRLSKETDRVGKLVDKNAALFSSAGSLQCRKVPRRMVTSAILGGVLETGVLEIWKNAEAVCFDVDSTVCLDEGIDELAAFCGAGEAVAAWTARAMGGTVPFEVALASRLDLFKPSASILATFLASKPPRLSSGIVELVDKLHGRGTHVYLVSGGFRQMIEPAAVLLHIPKERIYANSLLFKEDGEFAGFDSKEPTSRSGGKATVIEKIKQECGYKTMVMIGDGATDLEARRPGGADMFICYGGVVARPKVVEGADWFVSTFADLISLA